MTNIGNCDINLLNLNDEKHKESPYVLTSPRSLEACFKLAIKPSDLLKKSTEHFRKKYSYMPNNEYVKLFNDFEASRIIKLENCIAERNKLIKCEDVRSHKDLLIFNNNCLEDKNKKLKETYDKILEKEQELDKRINLLKSFDENISDQSSKNKVSKSLKKVDFSSDHSHDSSNIENQHEIKNITDINFKTDKNSLLIKQFQILEIQKDLELKMLKSQAKREELENQLNAWQDDIILYNKWASKRAEIISKQNFARISNQAFAMRNQKEQIHRQHIQKLKEERNIYLANLKKSIELKTKKIDLINAEKDRFIDQSRRIAGASERIRKRRKLNYSLDNLDKLDKQTQLENKVLFGHPKYNDFIFKNRSRIFRKF